MHSDILTSTFLSCSCIASLCTKIVSPIIWSKLRFFKSFLLAYSGLTIMMVQFYFWGSKTAFGLCMFIVVCRIFVNQLYIYFYLTKFQLFHPKIGLSISKYMDSIFSLGFLLVIIFNYFFYSEQNIVLIF